MAAQTRNAKQYSKVELYLGNLIIILWISLGALSLGLFNPFAAVGYFILVAFLVFYELGKHGCVTCYYCKTCTIGMGKLPGLFFRQKGTANVNRRALRLFPVVYVLLTIIPIIITGFSFLQEASIYKIALIAAILAFSAYTGLVRRKVFLTR
jgi:hypothetical protein